MVAISDGDLVGEIWSRRSRAVVKEISKMMTAARWWISTEGEDEESCEILLRRLKTKAAEELELCGDVFWAVILSDLMVARAEVAGWREEVGGRRRRCW